MGSEVERLHKKLDPEDDDWFGLLFAGGFLFLLFGVLYLVPFDPKLSDRNLLWIMLLGGGTVGVVGWYYFLEAGGIIKYFQVEITDFVNAYKRDNPERREIDILEMAYSDALSYAHKGFKRSFALWLLFGIWGSIVQIGAISGGLVVKKPSLFWLAGGITFMLSFVGFVFTILFYLRKRSIEKALFAIQLKKTDKAELSIKL